MSTITKLYPILKKTGLEDQDIQQFIGIIEESIQEGLVTKEDLKDTELRLTQKLHDTEIRLIKWVVGLMIAQTSIIIAVIKLL